jgi:2-dehydropantoate 2-reductase
MSSSAFREPLHILGAGSIGLLWAASIRSALPSYPVTLLLRDHHRSCTKDDQMNVSWKRLHQKSSPSEVSLPIQFSDCSERIQTLVLTTKAYQAKDAVKSVLDRLDPSSSKIIVLCNGALSVRDELSKIIDNIPLVLATTTHGAYRQGHEKEQLLVHAGLGKSFIEEETSSADLAELWNSVGLNCQAISSADMDRLLWKKLAANCVINPLTALFQCTNGELLMEPTFPELQQELLREIAQIAQKMGDHNMSEDSLHNFVIQVIQDTRNNKSSMYQDILKKQRTEVDHLNGYVVLKGRDLGIESPANEEIVQRVLELQHRW